MSYVAGGMGDAGKWHFTHCTDGALYPYHHQPLNMATPHATQLHINFYFKMEIKGI